MSGHKERTRFSAELDEDIRKMSKDNSIIEQNVLEKRFREETEAYEKYGIVPEVSEETHKKALEIMKKWDWKVERMKITPLVSSLQRKM